jgi:type IV pilus assembly protein PilX
MRAASTHNPRSQLGMALISSLLLLIVVTILALSLFRSFGIQEKIAGNVREKARALHAAESAEQYAEWWLTQGNAANPATACNTALSANLNEGQICSNALAATRTALISSPWPAQTITYNPGNSMVLTSASPGTANTFYQLPQFYIYDAGTSADGQGEVYQIDAMGYGANANTVAIVESTFEVSSGVVDRGGL